MMTFENQTTEGQTTELDPELAARLERLAARRAASGSAAPRPVETPPASASTELDPDLAARMERLAARRAASAGGGTSTSATAGTPVAQPRKKRRHPAQGSRVASLTLSLVTTIGLTTWMAGHAGPVLASSGGGVVGASATTTQGPVTVVPKAQTTAQTAHGFPPAVTDTAPTTTATATNTLVNGDTFTNRFGPVQVQATFAPDGSLTDVTVLQAPSGDRRSAQISNVAIPRLNSEALTAQTAHVDTISGATYTSRGYESSLQSAIDIARANAITNLG